MPDTCSCPTCGGPVEHHTADEGTQSYTAIGEPARAAEAARLEVWRSVACDARRQWDAGGHDWEFVADAMGQAFEDLCPVGVLEEFFA